MARKSVRRANPVKRAEILAMRAELRAQRMMLDQVCRDLETQLRRIGQLQAELDVIKRAWEKLHL